MIRKDKLMGNKTSNYQNLKARMLILNKKQIKIKLISNYQNNNWK